MIKVVCTSLAGAIICVLISSLSFQSDQIRNFTLPNVTSGTDFSLSQYSNADAVVIIFTSLYCPYAKFYEDRISRLTDQYRDDAKIRFILINPNNPTKSRADAPENIATTAKRLQLGIPVLIDQSQQVADLLGAEKTPEAFVLTPYQGSFRIAYRGAIDDNPQVEKDVRHHYLHSAIKAISQNQPVLTNSTPTTGCMIKR